MNSMNDSYVTSRGLSIRVEAVGPNETTIHTRGKSIAVPFPEAAIRTGLSRWIFNDVFIQDALGFLTADQREFLLTGMTPEEWNELFPPEDTLQGYTNDV